MELTAVWDVMLVCIVVDVDWIKITLFSSINRCRSTLQVQFSVLMCGAGVPFVTICLVQQRDNRFNALWPGIQDWDGAFWFPPRRKRLPGWTMANNVAKVRGLNTNIKSITYGPTQGWLQQRSYRWAWGDQHPVRTNWEVITMTIWWHAGLCWGQGDGDEHVSPGCPDDCIFLRRQGQFTWARGWVAVWRALLCEIKDLLVRLSLISRHWRYILKSCELRKFIEKTTFRNPSRAFLTVILRPPIVHLRRWKQRCRRQWHYQNESNRCRLWCRSHRRVRCCKICPSSSASPSWLGMQILERVRWSPCMTPIVCVNQRNRSCACLVQVHSFI